MSMQSQIELVGDIARVAAQISIQGRYHVIVRYSGHISNIDVDVYRSNHDYQGGGAKEIVPGFGPMENWISVEHGDLLSLYKKLNYLLDVDSDGVPV